MYSQQRPIGRTQIFTGFAAVLATLTGCEPSEPVQTGSEEVPGVDYLGYWAAHLTYRISAGEAALICRIDPILASMGVSGEDHSWSVEGLPGGVGVRGSAKSSARDHSYAELVIEGLPEAQCEALIASFAAAFPSIMTDRELVTELGER